MKFVGMKYIFTIILFTFCINANAYDDYINTTQADLNNSQTYQQKLAAYEKWLPLAILIHHPNTKADLDSFKTFIEKDNTGLGKGIYDLNMAYYLIENYGDYKKGLELCISAKDIFESINAKPQLVMTYNRLAFVVLWNQIGNKNVIVKENINDKYLSKALGFSKDLKDRNLEIITLGFIGSYFNVTENDNTKALNYFFEAEKLLDEETPPDIKLVVLESLSIVYADIHDEGNALAYLNKCEALSFFQQFGYGRSNMYRSIAKMYLTQTTKKNFTAALAYAHKAYNISLAMNAPEYISQGEQRLFEIYKTMGNEKMALYFHEKYKQHEDSLGRERFQRTYAEYDIIKKEATIKTLENDKLKEKDSKNNLIRNGLIFALISIAFFLLYFFRNNKKLQLKNEELKNKNEEIEKALFKGQNIERKRVAADLHDSLGVQANSILYNATLLKTEVEGKENRIDFLHETAKEMMLNLRETLWAMKSNDIIAMDVWLRVISFCQQMGRHYKHISITTDGEPPAEKMLTSPNALNVVMIIQEAINNAIKYSDTPNIIVKSVVADALWQIRIEDQGNGFDLEKATTRQDSYGLHNMKERAHNSNFTYNIFTELDKGTIIKIGIAI
jgi:two-component system, NarL family, sensor kinase